MKMPLKNHSDQVRQQIADRRIVLSIIIVNYMTREYLQSCLESIYTTRDVACQVIVVDNGSTDGSQDMVRENYPGVHLIQSGTNVGFARANNVGIRHATGTYILLLNPDTEITESSLERLVLFMERHPDVSAAGCRILYPDGRPQLSCGYFPSLATAVWGGEAINKLYRKIFPDKNFFGACGIAIDGPDEEREVETLLGACVIVRREILDQVGLFDENMFMYFEECDLFFRIKKAGGKIMYLPDATIYHHAGGSTKAIDKAVSYYQASQEYYFKKNHSLKHVIWLRTSIMISAGLKAVLLLAAYPFGSHDVRRRLMKKAAWHWHTFLYALKMLTVRRMNPSCPRTG